MTSKVVRWGNSLGLRVPAATARELRLVAGSRVDLRLASGALVVRPVPGPATLDALLGQAAGEPRAPAARRFAAWVPGRGDLILVSPEQRPALVVSPVIYATKAGCALICDIMDGSQGSPFGVGLPGGLPVSGVVLADRVGVVDVRAARGVRRVCSVPDEVVREVQERLLALVG